MVHMIYHRLYHMAHIISYDLYGIIGKIEVWRIFPCKLKWTLINMFSLSCFGKIIKFACFITLIMKLQPNDSVLLISACKVGCVFPTVIWSQFRMRQYGNDDHQIDAFHFTSMISHLSQMIQYYVPFLLTPQNQPNYRQITNR